MNNDLNVLLKVILDSSGIGKRDISKIQKKLEKYTVNVPAELDTVQLRKSIDQALEQAKTDRKSTRLNSSHIH